jgi:hypothetical protein
VLHGPPEALDERVVAPGAAAVRADGDAGTLRHLREVGAGELRSLVGVDDVRPAMAAERLLRRLDARCPPSA